MPGSPHMHYLSMRPQRSIWDRLPCQCLCRMKLHKYPSPCYPCWAAELWIVPQTQFCFHPNTSWGLHRHLLNRKSLGVKKLLPLTCRIAVSLQLRIVAFLFVLSIIIRIKLWRAANEGWQDCQKGNGINLKKNTRPKAHWILCRSLLTRLCICHPEVG